MVQRGTHTHCANDDAIVWNSKDWATTTYLIKIKISTKSMHRETYCKHPLTVLKKDEPKNCHMIPCCSLFSMESSGTKIPEKSTCEDRFDSWRRAFACFFNAGCVAKLECGSQMKKHLASFCGCLTFF